MVDIKVGEVQQQSLNDTSRKLQREIKGEDHDNRGLNNELVKQARDQLKIDYELNGSKYSSKHYAEIMDKRMPLICWRYLLHCQLNVSEAVDLMKSTLIWRQENNADESCNHQLIKEFWFHAPIMFSGVSKQDEDVLYIIGRHYRKPDSQLRPHLLNYTKNLLFEWDRKHRNDLRQFCFVFDVADTGFRNIDLEFMTWLVSVRDYLPARISKIYTIGTPVLLRPVIKLIISWLPEKFRNLIHFGSFEQLIEENIDRDQIPREAGGLADEKYYRLGPIDAPWQADMPNFSDPSMRKAINDSLWFHTNEERTSRLLKQQLEYERSVADK